MLLPYTWWNILHGSNMWCNGWMEVMFLYHQCSCHMLAKVTSVKSYSLRSQRSHLMTFTKDCHSDLFFICCKTKGYFSVLSRLLLSNTKHTDAFTTFLLFSRLFSLQRAETLALQCTASTTGWYINQSLKLFFSPPPWSICLMLHSYNLDAFPALSSTTAYCRMEAWHKIAQK